MIPVGCRHPPAAWLGVIGFTLLAGCSSAPPPSPELSPAEVQARQFEILERLEALQMPAIDFAANSPQAVVEFLNASFQREEADQSDKIKIDLRAGEVAEQPLAIRWQQADVISSAATQISIVSIDTNLLPGFIGPNLVLVSRFDPPEGFVPLWIVEEQLFIARARDYLDIEERLKATIIPNVDFWQMPLEETIQVLNAQIAEYSPEEKPPRVILDPSALEHTVHENLVSLELYNAATAWEVLRFILEIALVEARTHSGDIYLFAHGAGPEKYFSPFGEPWHLELIDRRLQLIDFRRRIEEKPPPLHPDWPATTDQAISRLLKVLSEKTKAEIRKMERPDFLHQRVEFYAEKNFGLGKGNYLLLLDLNTVDPEAVSQSIAYRIWRILRGELEPPPDNLSAEGSGWPDLLVSWEWVEDTPALLDEIRIPYLSTEELSLEQLVRFLNAKIRELNEYNHEIIIELHREADAKFPVTIQGEKIPVTDVLKEVSAMTKLECGVVDGKVLLVPADQIPKGFVSLWESSEEESAD